MKQVLADPNKGFLLVLILLTAACLRAPITGTGALISIISGELHMSSGAAGFLTTIPLMAFAAVSPMVVLMSGRMGAGRVLLLSLLILNAGLLIRSFCGTGGLFAGTVVIGMGVGVCNVLLPAVIKSYFPDRIASATSLYTVVMQLISTASTAVSVPIALYFDWKTALSIWLLVAVPAFLCCIPNRTMEITGVSVTGSVAERKGTDVSLYRKPLAWWVTAYMGFQSLIFYCFVAWLSPILQDKSYTMEEAGYLLSLFVIVGIVGSSLLPAMMKGNRSQSTTGMQLGILYLTGLVLMLFSNSVFLLLPAILLCGFCSGACFSFAMTLFGLHTANGTDASKLSGLAQSAGYLIAAAGPVLLGAVYDWFGTWTLPLIILIADAGLLIVLGRIVGRDEIL